MSSLVKGSCTIPLQADPCDKFTCDCFLHHCLPAGLTHAIHEYLNPTAVYNPRSLGTEFFWAEPDFLCIVFFLKICDKLPLCPHISSLAACPCNPRELSCTRITQVHFPDRKTKSGGGLGTLKGHGENRMCELQLWVNCVTQTFLLHVQALNFEGIISILGQTRNEDFERQRDFDLFHWD